MCLEKKWIKNKFTGKDILVNCGHCSACLQELADKRKQKINAYLRKYQKDDSDQIFVTLGYDNKYIPYVERADLDAYLDGEILNLSVYRDNYFKRSFNRLHEINEKVKIDEVINYDEESFCYSFDERNFKSLREKNGNKFQEIHSKIGVLVQKDIQLFFKRLRKYMERKYGFAGKYYYFYCGEYGETFNRPHFHIYIIAPKNTFKMFNDSILANWWFESDDFMQEHRRIERARKPAAYISSYVNCHSFLPLFFLENSFRPCFRGANGCEFRNEDFCYDEIVRKISRRTTRVPCKVYKNGVPSVEYVPLPSFVGNRYFPKFKGSSRLNDDKIFNAICTFGESLRNPQTQNLIQYVESDYYQIQGLFCSVFRKLNLDTSEKIADYARKYILFWNIRSSELLIDFYKEQEMDPSIICECYDNLSDYITGRIRAPTLDYFRLHLKELNPNNFVINRQNHQRLLERYNKFDKSKKINSIVFNV